MNLRFCCCFALPFLLVPLHRYSVLFLCLLPIALSQVRSIRLPPLHTIFLHWSNGFCLLCGKMAYFAILLVRFVPVLFLFPVLVLLFRSFPFPVLAILVLSSLVLAAPHSLAPLPPFVAVLPVVSAFLP